MWCTVLKPTSWMYSLVEVSGHNLESSDLRFPYTMFKVHYEPVSTHFCSREGWSKILLLRWLWIASWKTHLRLLSQLCPRIRVCTLLLCRQGMGQNYGLLPSNPCICFPGTLTQSRSIRQCRTKVGVVPKRIHRWIYTSLNFVEVAILENAIERYCLVKVLCDTQNQLNGVQRGEGRGVYFRWWHRSSQSQNMCKCIKYSKT
jgi:hypothetical protein